jgi:hypothetical protein
MEKAMMGAMESILRNITDSLTPQQAACVLDAKKAAALTKKLVEAIARLEWRGEWAEANREDRRRCREQARVVLKTVSDVTIKFWRKKMAEE